MFLSRMRLDLSLRKTMMALASPKLLHGAVERAFSMSPHRSRKLWRIDHLNGRCYLLLLSAVEPDLTSAVTQFGLPDEGWETKDYAPMLARITNGSEWRFRLTANPTVRKSAHDRPHRGSLYAHITVEHQRLWLADRAEKHGFHLRDECFDVVHNRWERFRKGGADDKMVTLLSVDYEGLLTVSDADLFRRVLTEGIGRGKAYGMGLMTVIPLVAGTSGR